MNENFNIRVDNVPSGRNTPAVLKFKGIKICESKFHALGTNYCFFIYKTNKNSFVCIKNINEYESYVVGDVFESAEKAKKFFGNDISARDILIKFDEYLKR